VTCITFSSYRLLRHAITHISAGQPHWQNHVLDKRSPMSAETVRDMACKPLIGRKR